MQKYARPAAFAVAAAALLIVAWRGGAAEAIALGAFAVIGAIADVATQQDGGVLWSL